MRQCLLVKGQKLAGRDSPLIPGRIRLNNVPLGSHCDRSCCCHFRASNTRCVDDDILCADGAAVVDVDGGGVQYQGCACSVEFSCWSPPSSMLSSAVGSAIGGGGGGGGGNHEGEQTSEKKIHM